MWGVVTVVFLLFNVLPGDPARMMLDQREDAEQLNNIRAKYGFDKPLATQYALYLNDLSPISIHSQDPNTYSNLQSKAYNYYKLVAFNSNDIVDLLLSVLIKKSFINPSFLRISAIFTLKLDDGNSTFL